MELWKGGIGMVETWEDLEKARKALETVAKTAKEVMKAITPVITSFVKWWNGLVQSEEDLNMFIIAQEHQLVSNKVLNLSCYKGKVGKKNMARIRKEVKRYERQTAGRCTGTHQP
jgi:methionine synthase I (cobalamin-dependent)